MSELLDRGRNRLEWARTHMDVLAAIRKDLVKSRAFRGLRVGMALHVEAKTGVLALTLKEAGAQVRLASCNPLSTDDAVVAALRDEGLETYAKKWETNEEYDENLHHVLDLRPNLVIDDGADLIFRLHTKRRELLPDVVGANEETTTGVIRVRAMEKEGKLAFSVFDVNDAQMKHLFDNRYGTGQSTIDGILTATNLLLAGKRFIVAGYGWCGRGVAMRARGMGAHVFVTEVDPIKAIEAKLDGFEVLRMVDAARQADFIVTATGDKDIVTAKHLRVVKDGCVLANAGHFNVEVSMNDLEKLATRKRRVREFVDEYALRGGKKVYVLGEGRLVNLAAGQGHPVEIMDMSFSIQALCAELLAKTGRREPRVYTVPREIDERVAVLKLAALGVEIDALSAAQRAYLASWTEGT
ncbi:MAG TPA: adenosylhomocysteinase [Candidatus Thermoplasmatota archaeon]|nr:adenosylhomocysteinase [Candidatus Thermoplasmatota archaeon]